MIVVSDSSPLIALSRTDHLSVLRRLFGTVLVPEAVMRELATETGWHRHVLHREHPWVEPRKVESDHLVSSLLVDLDPGEAEAIALAMEVDADLVLLDERRGRQRANDLGLRYTGTVGLLLEAKRRGYLPRIQPVLKALREAGFWLGEDVYQRALILAGE